MMESNQVPSVNSEKYLKSMHYLCHLKWWNDEISIDQIFSFEKYSSRPLQQYNIRETIEFSGNVFTEFSD